jgi:hypothetical protein
MTEVADLVPLSPEEKASVVEEIGRLLSAMEKGGPDCEAQCIRLAESAGLNVEPIKAHCARARMSGERKVIKPLIRPVAEPKVLLGKPTGEELAANLVRARFEFRPNEKVGLGKLLPLTIEDRDRIIGDLADLKNTDAFAYEEKSKAAAAMLYVNRSTIEKQVKLELARRPREITKYSQAMRVAKLCKCEEVELWCDEHKQGYASILIDGHRETYRIASKSFSRWLKAEYGKENPVKDGDQWEEQVVGSQALGDGIAQIEAWASRSGKEFTPALRTGGRNGEIWIDLGTPQWNAVHITGKGWSVVECPDVRFIRSGTLRPLPRPIRGGKIWELQSVLNVRPEDFVLVAAWLLQR